VKLAELAFTSGCSLVSLLKSGQHFVFVRKSEYRQSITDLLVVAQRKGRADGQAKYRLVWSPLHGKC
jgi:hypothetical protein